MALLSWTIAAALASGLDADAEAVLARAAAYVERYESELGSVVAEERYTQRVRKEEAAQRFWRPQKGAAAVRERRLVSDYLMLRLPVSDNPWLGFRDVFTVDDEPVRDRASAFAGLTLDSSEAALAAWRDLAQRSARYNIGNVVRTINIPTFALVVLRAASQKRFLFESHGQVRIGAEMTMALAFREIASPTLVKREGGEDLPLFGTAWIEPGSGRVVKTEVATDAGRGDIRSSIVASYRLEPTLGMWVPAEMNEHYQGKEGEVIVGEARYAGFRRFQVETDIVLPVPLVDR